VCSSDLDDLSTVNQKLKKEIADHKKAETQLREREEQYRVVVENAREAIVVVQDFKLVFVNYAVVNITSYPEKIFASKSFTEFIHPDDRNMVLDNHVKRLKGEKISPIYSYRILSRDGSIKWVETNSIVIQWKGKPAVLNFLNDITERKMAEEALTESKERFRILAEASYEGIMMIENGILIDYNDQLVAMLGYNREELTGRKILDFVSPEDRNIVAARMLMSQTDPYEYLARRKDGSAFPAEIHAKVSDISSRQLQVMIVRDMTERKRLEERLRRAEKMEALGTLAGGVAHDLNNVLGVLVGYSELLTEKLSEDNILKRYADNILQSSVRGAAIIQDLLTMARRGVTISEVVSLNKVVSDYLRTPEFEKLKSYHPGVKIRTDFEEGMLNIKGSPLHLGKTVMNLVSNAVEAIVEQGEVTIRTENRYLDQPIRGYDYIQEGDYAVLTISDTGRGISQRDVVKIFEPFYTKKVMGRSGTGLGLAVVWGTVKDHQGYIDVQSAEGRGSTFTIYFPVTREEPAKDEQAESRVAYMSKGESILVVDDVQEQREMAKNMLSRLGYQVETVASGEEAIEYLQNKKADLMVLDMIMNSGIDGMETYRRTLEINPGQKAVIVSGFSETDRVKNALEMGAGAFIRKPYILEKIGLAIRKELDRK
jgi:PAS domain S-box-containing protein